MPPSNWWERKLCNLQGCLSFHWLWFYKPVIEGGQVIDWTISESIGKGTAITRLNNRPVHIFRIKDMPAIEWDKPVPWIDSEETLIDLHSFRGDARYDWEVNFITAVWYICRHYFGKVIPVIQDGHYNCVEWVCLFARELHYELIPSHQYPMQSTLEKSPVLKYLGEVNG
jgi:hypothetical protein